ncbi:hypothetical protein BB559_005998 [Furculomyces boomerangus]|uniref:Nuclear protein localization protein 4 n=1 Tax=Furculomyces boomerangus TaxID=61424 RepID=A0A2T9Y5B6_9FUNG|nr:hypothetical protein BB559_005998 [Furculomyces boomerangus]
MIIRVRSPQGTERVNLQDSVTNISELISLIKTQFKKSDDFLLYYDPTFKKEINLYRDKSKSVSDLGLKHGDMIYIKFPESEKINVEKQPQNNVNVKQVLNAVETPKTSESSKKNLEKKQNEIDYVLEKESGSIIRKRDVNFCQHLQNAMCEYCMPLEPFDPSYLKENKIKHMSFHSYLRKVVSNNQRESGLGKGPLPGSILPLEEPFFSAKPDCTGGHAPWPEGICTKCQPSAITLQQQMFRMTDHLEFAEGKIVDRMLSWWRETGTQRFGLMYGRYEKYTEVPLGIKAVVEAIYEPAQTNMADGLIVNIESNEFNQEVERVNVVAKACGLELLGMIITDLTDDGSGAGKVEYKRNKDSYFLTSMECRLAAKMQILNPNYSRWSQSGIFGSRFVTAIVSGNEDHDIDISSWQISNTGMGLEKSNFIVSSSEPDLLIVREPGSFDTGSSGSGTKGILPYVPEILYKYKNEYGVTVMQSAKPSFPVEYLLVSLTHGFPSSPNPTFRSENPYFIENRHSEQSTASLYKHLSNLNLVSDSPTITDQTISGISDFHLLVYLESIGILSVHRNNEKPEELSDIELLCKAALPNQDSVINILHDFVERPNWKSLATVLSSSHGTYYEPTPPKTSYKSSSNMERNPPGYTSRHDDDVEMDYSEDSGSLGNQRDVVDLTGGPAVGGMWVCRHCTFENEPSTEWCAICGLPQHD